MQKHRSSSSQVVDREGRNWEAHSFQSLIQNVGRERLSQAASTGQNERGVPGEVSEFFKQCEHLAGEIDGVRLACFGMRLRNELLAFVELNMLPASVEQFGLAHQRKQDDVER